MRGTNWYKFLVQISSAPFFWGVTASFARVYISSSAPQSERHDISQGGVSYDQIAGCRQVCQVSSKYESVFFLLHK
jgi:hypothetical protein